MRDEEVPAEERVARSPMVDTDGKIPPATPRAPSMSATPRPESVAPAPMSVSPTKKTFALRSAWGGGGAAKGETDEPEDMGDIGVGGDQMELDLSDLIGDEGVEDTTPISPVEEVLPVVESEMDKFEKLPVVWSGQVCPTFPVMTNDADTRGSLSTPAKRAPSPSLSRSGRSLTTRSVRRRQISGNACCLTIPSPSQAVCLRHRPNRSCMKAGCSRQRCCYASRCRWIQPRRRRGRSSGTAWLSSLFRESQLSVLLVLDLLISTKG